MSLDKKHEVVYNNIKEMVKDNYLIFERTRDGFMLYYKDGKCLINGYNLETTGQLIVNEFFNADGTELFNFVRSSISAQVNHKDGVKHACQWRFQLK